MIRKTQKPFSYLWSVTRPDTTRLASILVVNETHDGMPLAKSIEIGCSAVTVAGRPSAAAHPMCNGGPADAERLAPRC
jgi:hypothetical protein